ncbi:MAG: hypothetical protein ABI947_23345, partial [Chloroflexota bacterium]
MAEVAAYKPKSPGPGEIDMSRIVVAVVGSILTLLGLYAGFIFLRDSKASRLVIGTVAIVWGLGGVGALFFMANWIVESF